MESIVKWIPVLTVKECRILRKVKTTEEQALVIRNRNAALLAEVEADYGDYYGGTLGCPHCIEAAGNRDKLIDETEDCRKCCWNLPVLRPRKHHRKGLYCCRMTFGGFRLQDCSGLSYSRDKEGVNALCAGDNTATFLRGHIEWAEHVLGLIPWPEGSE